MEDILVNGLNYFLISSLVTIAIAMIINFVAHRLIKRFNKKYSQKITTNQYLYQTVRLLTWSVALIIIIRQIKPLSSLGDTLLGATSIIAIAVGIAAQATFGNYIAGFFLAVHQPFKVGDVIYIKERGLSGTVQEITFRHTVLLTQENTEIIIPNTIMNAAVIEDLSSESYSRLIELNVSGETDLDTLEKIIVNLLKEEELINKDQEIKLIIKEFIKDGYTVAFPIHTYNLHDYVEIKNSFYPKLYKALKKHKINLI